MGVEACRWIGGALIDGGQPYPSCVPCESVDTAVNSLDDVAEVNVSYNTNEYQVETKMNRAGSYHLVGGVLQQGRLKAMFFRNPDFTDYVPYSFSITED